MQCVDKITPLSNIIRVSKVICYLGEGADPGIVTVTGIGIATGTEGIETKRTTKIKKSRDLLPNHLLSKLNLGY